METPFAYLEDSMEEPPFDFINVTEYVTIHRANLLDLKVCYNRKGIPFIMESPND